MISENDMEDQIAADPEHFLGEPDLVLVARQFSMDVFGDLRRVAVETCAVSFVPRIGAGGALRTQFAPKVLVTGNISPKTGSCL
jgi:hypothetical protein